MLRCHVPNPFTGNPGEPDTVEEVPPKIGFVPGVDGSVWLPSESGYASVCMLKLNEALLIHLTSLAWAAHTMNHACSSIQLVY